MSVESEVRQLSDREKEQLALTRDRLQHQVDEVDKQWPNIVVGAAMYHDCCEALEKNGFSRREAVALAPQLANYIRGR